MKISTTIFQNRKTNILVLKPTIILLFILLFSTLKLFSQATLAPNKTDTTLRNESIIFNQKKFDTISMAKMDRLKEELRGLSINGGNIFFTGTGFFSPIYLQISSNGSGGSTILDQYFARCAKGSRFTMEKCVVTTKDGVKHIVTKAIFF